MGVFFGSIGYFMVGLGVREFLELIYRLNIVDYIFIGKVIVWVVCVYFIVDVVLNVFFCLGGFLRFLFKLILYFYIGMGICLLSVLIC